MTLPPCLFRTVTALPCPSCGMTRAALALGQGDWRAALAWHPLSLVLVAEVAILGVILLDRRRRRVSVRPPQRVIDATVAANVALLLGTWGVRLGSGWRG